MSTPPTSAPAPALARLMSPAADALAAVRAGRAFADVLARCPADLRPGAQALLYEALRRLGGAAEVRALMAPKAPPPPVDALLLLAIALLWPRAPGDKPPYADHTVVDQAVAAAHKRTPAATGFINAVLRRFVRERDALVTQAMTQPLAAFEHPLWWLERVKRDWPTQWQAVLAAGNDHAPMFLRVNARRTTAEAYVQRLAAQGRSARTLPEVGAQAVVLDRPCNVQELPGFADGDVSVQDLSAQRAAPLLIGTGAERLPAGARVLDACAAPGGKTAHLLELADLDVLALDSDGQRLARVHDTLRRLHLEARSVAADARATASWWDGQPFDAILLDAPCTASGIERRHPDVRWLRRPDDVAALARTQAELLDALWPLLKPGGRLLYATCSVFRQEGQQQVDAFLQRLAAGEATLDPASPGHLLPLPDNAGHASAAPAGPMSAVGDGFFYALIRKH